MKSHLLASLLVLSASLLMPAAEPDSLSGTSPLEIEGDISAQMVTGIGKFFQAQTERSIGAREKFWKRDFSSPSAYEASVEPNRQRLRKIIGAADERLPVSALEFVSGTDRKEVLFENEVFKARAVRWPVFEGVHGEGIWLEPTAKPLARVVVIPDADQTPELLAGLTPGLPAERQLARRLAENGCEVLVPALIDRQDTWSGSAELNRFTNQPHREWIYRQAYELGRHIIGYEVQKVLAALHYWSATPGAPTGVAGYGEGALIALYSGALDPRIQAVLASGYFDSRQRVSEEPIYRNVFGLLREFGDAEIATLIAPRVLVVEHSPVAKIDGPPAAREGRQGAAPGRLGTPDYQSVENEFERARDLLKGGNPAEFARFQLIAGTEGMPTGPGSDRALLALLNGLGIKVQQLKAPAREKESEPGGVNVAERQRRQVSELVEFTQALFRKSGRARAELFWNRIDAKDPEAWKLACAPFKRMFWEEVIGQSPVPAAPLKAKSRRLATNASKWTGYEIVLDVCPDVFAWGYLLVPKDIKPGERRPVVVCQHGLEGVPEDVINEDPASQAFGYYKAFGARLAERGFVVFAPHNPYRGGDRFRQQQREANPLGQSLFSIIIAQHNRILDWLSEQAFVDPARIGFYGLSYGGKTAMRVPAVLDRYAVSICSGDFNEWVRKNVALDYSASYMFLGEYEMPEFNLGGTFNYAEMAGLICPRPFMVERGHNDGVGLDEWVAAEYATVRRLYDQLGIPERTTIEYFNGPHTIHGVGTYDFLHEHLHWPKPKP